MAQGASRGFEANSFEIKMLSERGRRRGLLMAFLFKVPEVF